MNESSLCPECKRLTCPSHCQTQAHPKPVCRYCRMTVCPWHCRRPRTGRPTTDWRSARDE